ncbi:FGGY-family carbohydrate kinase [Oceanicola sp. S124]|uniref:FGGY-family carbohydrate kinase n=1 Tax=Oceanicola sp. S124 TaxID=1042378 RepID=UPI0002558A0D|nr:FGGY-family carbohydrate kinase [Oceanicola sp. S124]
MSYIGIDVGTGSARAGVFNASGDLLGAGSCAIRTYRPRAHHAQQASAEIWAAVCASVRAALKASGLEASAIRGLGFDATCSLVVSDARLGPVSVDPEGAPGQDVMLWMDHRALGDAEEINAIGGAPLAHVGGRISPEMELPKLRWMKRELPGQWAEAAHFWDLPDWLVHRATGDLTRSLCSTVCKWTYLGHKGTAGEGWDDAFLANIGLEELSRDDHAAIGASLASPGAPCGGLSERAAEELGLAPGTPVAASVIDAYAGALGTLGLGLEGDAGIDRRLAVIAGTSTCHIALSREAIFVPGVWGPYFGAALPEFWALEGGQSAAGALMDAVIARHAASVPLAEKAARRGTRVATLIEEHLAGMGEETALLTRDRHIQPDFHGNRSPLAEPWRQGGVSGLTLEGGLDDLALDYLATVQALAYGSRHIIEAMRAKGAQIDTLVMSGGLAANALYLREHADATGCRVLVPEGREPVLLGSAMLGAVAAGDGADLPAMMAAMSGGYSEIHPRGGRIAAFHDRKYRVMRRMQDDHAAYRTIMEE